VILKAKKKEHLDQWRSTEGLKKSLTDDNEDDASNFFDHGIDPNM